MADLAVTNTFVSSTLITASAFNTNFSDVVNYINARNQGTAWDALASAGTLAVTGAATLSSTLAVTGAITATGGIANLFAYRRPKLIFASTTTVNVENNTGTAHQTTIVFPDGTIRSVTEDVGSTNKYRQFNITATAEFTTGTEDSGLYTGLSEATNTWYAIYAVKSLISATKFVLVGTTTLPLQANYATLNTNLGTNGWVYLGMIRNGDNAGATGDIISFTQSGPHTVFDNTKTSSIFTTTGITLATATATSITYTIAYGTGAANIPNHVSVGDLLFQSASTTNRSDIQMKGGAITLLDLDHNDTLIIRLEHTPLSAVAVDYTLTNGTSNAKEVGLTGYIDNVLAAGSYAVL